MPAETTASSRVIEALRMLPPGALYGLAPKAYIQRGIGYYMQRRLDRFRADRDGALLAEVMGSRRNMVEITEEDGRPSFYCDCPAWAHSTQCKHVVCAVLTFKNIFQPRSFGLPPLPEDYREALAAELEEAASNIVSDKTSVGQAGAAIVRHAIPLPPAQAVSGPAVVIKWGDGATDIFVEKDGRRLSNSQKRDLPYSVRLLSDAEYLSFYYKTRLLFDYLCSPGEKLKLLLRTKEGDTRCVFDPDFPELRVTELDASGGTVVLSRRCMHNGRLIRTAVIDDRVLVDTEEGRMGVLKTPGGWPLWEELLQLSDLAGRLPEETGEVRMTEKRFSRINILFPSESLVPKSLALKISGEASDVFDTETTVRICIVEGHDSESYTLKLEILADGHPIDTCRRMFDFFQEIDSCSHYLRAKKRRQVLVKTFFEMASAPSAKVASSAMKSGLSGEDFRRRNIKLEAVQLLKQYYERRLSSDRRIVFAGGRWLSCPVDKDRESLLYKTVLEVFGPSAFEEMPSHCEVKVTAADLFSCLPLLYERLNDSGVPLYFGGRPVASASWDISFDIARDGIDWFEIRPEIRCNGEHIDDRTWDEIISGRQVVEQDGVIRITDANTRRVLDAISSVYGSGGRKRPKDKEVVRVPRLRVLDWLYLRSQGVKVKLPKEDEAILERLTSFEKIRPMPLPKRIKARLRPYQKDGYSWLAFLYEHGFGACLADDMGLGKTLQAITLLAGLNEGTVSPRTKERRPHLVVLPPSLLFNWENEIRRFCPGMKTVSYTGVERTADFDDADVVLTTYAIVRRDIKVLEKIGFDVAIFDEAQAVKNILADTTGAVRRLKAGFKLTVTGTPLENHLGEYYSIIDLAVPGLLGEYDEFKPLINRDGSVALDIIIGRTRPFVLRRTKEKILKELPQKVETDVYLDLTERQKALYKRTVEEVRRTIDDAYRTKTQAQARIIALTAMMKLRQICVSPVLLSKDAKDSSPKTDFLIEKLRELMDEGHGSLVFSQFTSFLDLLEPELRRSHIPFIRLDGSTPVGKRKKLVEQFQKGDGTAVFLLSLKAGGQGLNLTKASYVFHLDPWWNPAVENQASDRAHRIGQKNRVTVTRLLMRHTIEEKMMALKEKKRELFRNVLDGAAGSGRGARITKADFEYLLG